MPQISGRFRQQSLTFSYISDVDNSFSCVVCTAFKQSVVRTHYHIIDTLLYSVKGVLVHQIFFIFNIIGRLPLFDRIKRLLKYFLWVNNSTLSEKTTFKRLIRLKVNFLCLESRLILKHFFS